MTTWTARTLLGRVLVEGRDQSGRSPEGVAAVTGVSGKTIRRLEDGETARPRPVTLDSLAAFYALDGALLRQLAEWGDLAGQELSGGVHELAVARLGPDLTSAAAEADDPLLWLAMRLARSGAARPAEPARIEGDPAQPLLAAFGSGMTHRLLHLLGAMESEPARDDVAALLDDALALDPRRRRLARELVAELRTAQELELADFDPE